MKELTKRAALFFIGAAIVLLGVWLGGFDFNERGWPLLAAYIVSLSFGFWLACMPGIKGGA